MPECDTIFRKASKRAMKVGLFSDVLILNLQATFGGFSLSKGRAAFLRFCEKAARNVGTISGGEGCPPVRAGPVFSLARKGVDV